MKRHYNQNEKHWKWTGDEATYHAKHKWLIRNYGNANCCEKCGILDAKYEWANISGEYKRDREDFMMLCISCHRTMDKSKDNRDYCVHGHPLVDKNLMWATNYAKGVPMKKCRFCSRMKYREYNIKKSLVASFLNFYSLIQCE